MNVGRISVVLIVLCFLNTFVDGSDNPTDSTGSDVSINCGSSGTFAARNGREWIGDVQQKYSSGLQVKGSSTTSSINRKSAVTDPVPYESARASSSQFSYAFQVDPGQKIIRLHFNPVPYRGFTRLTDLFTVEAGPFVLLDNFSASITADTLGLDSLVKEFVIHVEADKTLNINFSPAMSQSRDSTYAFVNGIEIISVPSSLSYFHQTVTGVQVIGKSLVHVDYNTALEIINRQNFKQSVVVPNGHFDDLFPLWAMRKTNSIKSETWKISADVGFRYLIRLHFSEHGLELAKNEEVIFKVVINEMIAQTNIDILNEWGDNGIPRYSDYMVTMRGHKKEGRRDILITLQTSNKSIDGRPVLTGFEIFKLSNPDNSLASPNPLPPQQDSPSRTQQTLFSVFSYRNAIAAVAITTISLVNIIVHKFREIWEASDTEEENRPSARAARFCRRFSFAEIQLATRNFNYIIGKGGFGYVYKGIIDNGQETVAVKRLKTSSKQGAREFLTEIEMLSELRHINLVSLIGYCNEHGEMILVYEYVANGTLADHLYKLPRESNDCPLTWKQRLNICIGAGRGLEYLHTGHRVIHRDVKASNILLNENYEAKVSDFGLAKPEDRRKLESHVSTNVKGTFGYFDPYYINTRKLTRKSDTYAFGVVLLEVLCRRPAMDSEVAANERFLAKWAQDKISKGEVDQIVDSCLREHISQDSLKTFVAVAERCIYNEPKQRPTMSEVVLQLESALVQEQSNQLLVPNEIASVSDDICPGQVPEASIDAQNPTPPKEQTDSRVVGAGLPPGRKDGRKRTHKPPRFWPWNTLWNRWSPSRENDMLLSAISEANVKLTKFDWATMVAATDDFSFSNKVGPGGFGSVYKAVLPTGQVAAVKRFSSHSARGTEEFKNEILLLPNLQHKNIIKLLGYCIHREEKLTVYEFMENRSLRDFIEDQHRHLEWRSRLKIIMGIAQGVVYLHEDSGLGVVYRDLKPSNILLDNEMNPKISDFALARASIDHQSESETRRIVGTYGFMAPEYCMQGKYSVKTDVYSFGVTVLEIVSGRRCRHYQDLIPYAWKLWNERKAIDLVDESLGRAFPMEEALRCIQVGLLSTQELPHHRPTMPSVIKMLQGEEVLVEPQEPQPQAKTVFERDWFIASNSTATFEFDDTLER